MERRMADREARLDRLEIGAFDAAETKEVLDILSRSMRDNPLHVAAFGHNPERRLRRLRTMMAVAFSAKDFSHSLVVRRETDRPRERLPRSKADGREGYGPSRAEGSVKARGLLEGEGSQAAGRMVWR